MRSAGCIAIIVLLTGCAAHLVQAPAPIVASPAVTVAAPSGPQPPRFRCDHEIQFTVRFGDDSAQLDAGTRGSETLLRDAGGTSPQQTVYSSTTMKAEFGLGDDGREAKLHLVSPPLEAHCVRE